VEPSIDLQKYVKSFLETGDYTVFGHGDQKALEPAIVNFCLENEVSEIMVSSASIETFSELLEDYAELRNKYLEQNYQVKEDL